MQIQKPCNKQISRKIEKLENTKIFFIIEESKATILDFTQKNMKVLPMSSANLFWC